MFQAILVPQTPEYKEKCDSLTSPIFTYLPNSDYLLCLATEEIPSSFKDLLVPAQLDTGHKVPVHAYQHYYAIKANVYNPELSKDIIAFKSRVTYAISENLAPNDFYLRLYTPPNEDLTERSYIFELMFKNVPCLTTPELLSQLLEANLASNLGPLIVSTYTLSSIQAPHWYIRETLRDLVELGDLDMENKVLIEGPRSKEPYLFYAQPDNIPEDVTQKFLGSVRDKIEVAIELKIFPRNTPDRYIKSRRLTPLPSGQFEIQPEIPKNTPYLAERMELNVQLKDIKHLYWFLTTLRQMPTWGFISPELEISVQPYGIIINYQTEYLVDYLRVQMTTGIQPPNNPVKIIYPRGILYESLEPQLEGKKWIEFEDKAQEQSAILAADISDLPEIPSSQIEPPLDFSLESRLEIDLGWNS